MKWKFFICLPQLSLHVVRLVIHRSTFAAPSAFIARCYMRVCQSCRVCSVPGCQSLSGRQVSILLCRRSHHAISTVLFCRMNSPVFSQLSRPFFVLQHYESMHWTCRPTERLSAREPAQSAARRFDLWSFMNEACSLLTDCRSWVKESRGHYDYGESGA